ncbi:MAG: hypothetical protein CVV27_02225 [Candidatus Melainabacteria bacterium HGW-Melainabacteria-1]|nr:MAG: hypothetical protein CVV27_02225 [Candidatus Melainabacteria bacterium HGW-Melainabacteria-1]
MIQLSGSWGLVLDLGDEIAEEALRRLYDAVWQASEFTGPRFKLGDYKGLPRGAEGSLTLAGQSGQCYTKFEQDTLGYPPGWQVPLSFSLSLFGFATPLPDNQTLYQFLRQQAQAFYELLPYRMAVIGELSCYYLNAEFLNEDWIDLQQQSLLALLLPPQHPFGKRHSGQSTGPLQLYEQEDLRAFWSTDSEQDRYLRFKQRISNDMHSPRQDLDWERPNQN